MITFKSVATTIRSNRKNLFHKELLRLLSVAIFQDFLTLFCEFIASTKWSYLHCPRFDGQFQRAF